MAKFTIGIPTYNRSHFLPRAIEAALAQTYPDVEVLVSDNASTDETADVVRSFGDRVRYHRNETNIGMWPNLSLVTELASGDYFSWLQDDDLVHCDFARRAAATLDADQSICMYTSFSITGWSTDTFFHPQLYGPPISLDWMGSSLRILDGSLIPTLSMFATFSMPPVTAYRTAAIRRACQGVNPDDILFNERIIQSRVVIDSKVAVDPCVGGLFYKHDQQGHILAGRHNPEEHDRQWMNMAASLVELLEQRPGLDWKSPLESWLDTVSTVDALNMVGLMPSREKWSSAHPLIGQIASSIDRRLPTGVEAARKTDDGILRSLKGIGRQLTPPLMWSALRRLKQNPAKRG